MSAKHSTGDLKNRGGNLSREVPDGQVDDSSYATGSGEPIPVQKDSDLVDDPVCAETADSDAQLARDDKEAIDTSNILNERTRGVAPAGTYREPGDDEGLPE